MAKIRLEWLAMASVDSARGQITDAAATVYGTQTLDVAGVSTLSEPAPDFVGARGLARVIALAGAAYGAWGADPTADAEGLLVYPGRERLVAVKPGERLAFVAAPTMVEPVGATPLIELTAIIPAGQSETGEIDLGSAKLVGLGIPHPWTDADLSLLALDSTGVSGRVFNHAGLEQIVKLGPIAAARRVSLPITDFAHLSRFKLLSVIAGNAVNQSAERTIAIFAQP